MPPLGLAEKLTNPLAGPDLRKVAADLSAGRKVEVKGKMSFFPPLEISRDGTD